MPHEDDRTTPLPDLDSKKLDAKTAEKVKGGKVTPSDIPFVKKIDKSSPSIG